MIKPIPPQEELLSLFDYSIITGLLYYKTSPSPMRKVGTVAGTVATNGYRNVTIKGKRYKEARIIWMMMTGDDPGKAEVDHKNHIRDNNAWHNLRLLNRSKNGLNKTTASETPLIHYLKANKRYYLQHAGNYYGCFKTLKDAENRRDELGLLKDE